MAASQTAEHSSSEEIPAEAHAETHIGRGSGAAKGTRRPADECVAAGGPAEASGVGGPSGKGRKRGGLRSQAGDTQVLREADKANGARLGAAEDCGGMNNNGGMRRHMKAIGGLSDYTQVSENLTNMEGKRLLRLPARASQSLRLLGVTSSRYRMGLQASNSSRAGQGA